MSLSESSFANIMHKCAINRGTRLLIGLSGGLDSVTLFHMLRQSAVYFEAAHCNFQLRGEDAEADQEFCRSLCKKHQVKLHEKRFEVFGGTEGNTSAQKEARILRYGWFEELRKTEKLDLIAVAHHLDDQVETILLHIAQGCGIGALRGMEHKQDKLVRPLLDFTRTTIHTFATERQLEWREDASNKESKYRRNLLRNEIVPLLNQLNSGFNQHLINLSKIAKEQFEIEQTFLEKKRRQLIKQRCDNHCLAIKAIRALPYPVSFLYHWLSKFGFNRSQCESVMNILDAQSGRRLLSDTHCLFKDRRHLILSPLQTNLGAQFIEKRRGKLRWNRFELVWSVIPRDKVALSTSDNVALIDFDLVRMPLALSIWQEGDYFYPLGMRKKKKLSRFFIDQKLPLAEKNTIGVLKSGDHILWVIGHRIDDRFKLTPATKNVLKLTVREIKRD